MNCDYYKSVYGENHNLVSNIYLLNTTNCLIESGVLLIALFFSLTIIKKYISVINLFGYYFLKHICLVGNILFPSPINPKN